MEHGRGSTTGILVVWERESALNKVDVKFASVASFDGHFALSLSRCPPASVGSDAPTRALSEPDRTCIGSCGGWWRCRSKVKAKDGFYHCTIFSRVGRRARTRCRFSRPAPMAVVLIALGKCARHCLERGSGLRICHQHPLSSLTHLQRPPTRLAW